MPDVLSVTGGLLAAVFCGGVLGLGLAYAAWQRRDVRAAKPFALYSLMYSGWMFAAGLLWLSPSTPLALVFDLSTELFGAATALVWVLFVVSYTEQRDRFAGWRQWLVAGYAAALVVRYAAIAVLWLGTPPGIDTYRGLTVVTTRTAVEPKPYGALTVVAGLALLFWTFYLLWRYARSEVGGQKQQARLTLLAGIAPTVIYVGYTMADITLHEHLDPTPLFFVLSVTGTWFALFVYDFLDVEPVVANALFERMTDPVLILDEDNTVLNANDSATSLDIRSGDTPPAPLVGAIAGTGTELTLETVDGDERVFDLSVSAIGDGQRRLVVLRDITLRTEREQELTRQNERLDEFAAVVSHDLRNPLTVAEGKLQLLEETDDLDHTDGIRRGLERIDVIIEDLLTMARAGEAIDSAEPVDVAGTASEAWDHVLAEDASLDMQIQTEITVQADRGRLLQLFENLFRNAIDHNDGPLTITVEPITDDGSVGFAVSDNGSGIPPADRERVFEHGHTTSDGGTGLGLSIVHDIVSAHGGTIRVTESETGGARFEIVDLPPGGADPEGPQLGETSFA